MERESALEAIFEETESDLSDCDDEPQDGGDARCMMETANDLEEGEVACAYAFHSGDNPDAANDLDTAIEAAKNAVMQARLRGVDKKRRKEKRRRKSKALNIDDKAVNIDDKAVNIDDIPMFISQMSLRLREPKTFLVEAAVNKIGAQAVLDLVREVETVERHGGQMTADGKRRRTPGGVLWNILRSRQSEVYKDIMAKGKEVEKEKRKRKVEHCMEIDEQHRVKRRRRDATGSCSVPSAQVKKTGRSTWPKASSFQSRHVLVEPLINTKDDLDSIQSSFNVQGAWVQGVKRGKILSGLNEVEMHEEVMRMKPASMAERIRVPVNYDDLVESCQGSIVSGSDERIQLPVDNDLVESHQESRVCGSQERIRVPSVYEDLVESYQES